MMDIPDGFKMTNIGLVPEEWEVTCLGDVASLVMGQSPPGDTYNEVGDGMPFLQGKAEFGSVSPKHVKYTSKPMKMAPSGSVLISVRAPVGDVNLANIDYCIGRGLASLSLNAGDNVFLLNLMRHLKKDIEKEGTGSTFKAINKSKLWEFKIPIPPLPEQKKIAAVLSAVQDAKEKTEAVIQASRELKKSLMKHLFTYGPVSPTDAADVPLKETEIGMVPEEWDVVELGDVASVQGGYAFKSKDYVTEGTPLLRISNVSIGRISWDDIAFLPEELLPGCSGYLLSQGDMVMAMTRPIISTGIKIARLSDNDVPCLLNQRVCRFITTDNIDTEYLFQILFDKNFIISISDGALGSQQPNISASKIEGISIPCPSIDIQQQIADILSAVDQKIEAEEGKKAALEELFKTLLSNLMTGRIRVNNLEMGGE